MWDTLVECVPNVSEGRDRALIQTLTEAVQAVEGVVLLDASSDEDHHRSVFTMVGLPDGIEQAVLALCEVAVERIDLRQHRGEHPRMGAVDVVPLIPVRGVTMDDCVALSRRVGQAIWERFGVPVFLYEASAASPKRRNLAAVRKGEFEGFAEKLSDTAWQPDFGDARLHPTAGATAVGAREFLIAYNVNLGTSDLRIAQEIARAVRGSSGGFRYVKALGLELAEQGIVQVSMNLTNYKKTPIPRVLECVRREAQRRGVAVVGTEIVGLVPQAALDDVVTYYTGLDGLRSQIVVERRIDEMLR